MLERILQLLAVACAHKNISQPFATEVASVPGASWDSWDKAPSGPAHYVVCLDCGKQFAYDWEHMRILR